MNGLKERLGVSEGFLCLALATLTVASVEGECNCLCSSQFHNRMDYVSRNAFGMVSVTLPVAMKLRKSSNVAGFLSELKASWSNSIADIHALWDAYNESPRSLEVLDANFLPFETIGRDALTLLGAKKEDLQHAINSVFCKQIFVFSGQPSVTVPMLVINTALYSPAKQAAILDALAAVIDRLVAMEDPQTTTVAQLLGADERR